MDALHTAYIQRYYFHPITILRFIIYKWNKRIIQLCDYKYDCGDSILHQYIHRHKKIS